MDNPFLYISIDKLTFMRFLACLWLIASAGYAKIHKIY